MKINELSISNFRGISKTRKLIFTKNSKPRSILIYGDNGTGKSSFLDAIEFIAQGTIQNRRTTSSGDWIYSSNSKVNYQSATKVCCKFDNGLCVEKDYVFDDNKLNIVTFKNEEELNKNISIPSFCHAPLVLRRRDIIKFWDLDSIERMKIFIPFASPKNDVGFIPITEQEKIDRINKKRLKFKEKRNDLLQKICKEYNWDYEEEQLKDKNRLFLKIKKREHIRKLNNLRKTKSRKYRELRRLYRYYDVISGCNKSIKHIRKKYKALQEKKNGKFHDLKKIMEKISPEITKWFKNISPSSDCVDRIIVSVAKQTDISINFDVILTNGLEANPEKYFSEANRDLLALLLYFEFIYAKSFEGQNKVLILDDVFQSIDSTIRLNLVRYLLKRFNEWQFILTTHDKLWKEQLINLFRNHNSTLVQYEINRWSLLDGPQLAIGINNYDEKLKEVICNGDAVDISARAGYLLEYLCENLSVIIHSGVQRKKDDRYTIGDLWPGILKIMKRTPAKETFETLNDFIMNRNLIGAHYNEWAVSASKTESIEFGELVLRSYYSVFYKDKGNWINDKDEITGEEL